MTEALKLKGKLIEKFETEFVGDNKFPVRKFAIEVENERNADWNFPRGFQLVKDRVDMLDAYEIGDEIIVSYNLRGRVWASPDKGNVYFNTDEAWRLEPVNDSQAGAQEFNAADMPPAPEEDDLPFN